MKCNIIGINRDNAPNINPSFTRIVNTLDTALFGDYAKAYADLDQPIPTRVNDLTTDVLKNSLVSAMVASHSTIQNSRQIIIPVDTFAWQNITSLDSLNTLFKTNYGITQDVFSIESRVRYNSNRPSKVNFNVNINGRTINVTENNNYIVHVNPDVLRQLENNFTLSMGNTANRIQSQRDQIEIERELEEDRRRQEMEDMLRNQDPYFDPNDSKLEVGNPVNYYDTKDQIIKLQQAFAAAGISVKIEINPTLESKGRVKAINENTAIIELNPNKMTDDTHYHEFSHILIDLLGVDHPIVQQAITQLQDTVIAAKVREKYPELSGERLDKEIVVTAIGLASAKINRTKPNLFQQIFNKIARALRTLFKVKEDAIEKLAQQLLDGRFDRTEFKGSLRYYSQSSKNLNNTTEKLEDIVIQVRVAVEDSILKLERASEATKKESAINELKILKTKLEKVTAVEQLLPFIQYTTRLVARAEYVMDHISEKFTEGATDPQERMEMINTLVTVGKNLKDFFDGDGSLIAQIKDLLRKELKKTTHTAVSLSSTDAEKIAAEQKREKLSNAMEILSDSLDRLTDVNETYYDQGLPLLVDLFLDYHTPEINTDIKAIQDNNSKYKRTIGLNKATIEYRNIEEKYKGKLTDAQKAAKQDELVALANQQLEGSKIGRETLIAELRDAQKDKSSFSFYLDPFVHSSQPALQLFATFLKDHLYKGSDDVRELIYRLSPAYQKFASVKGADLDPNKFNEELLEVVPYSLKNDKTGTYETMRVLSFAQPFDMNKFNASQAEAYRLAAEKTGRPKRSDTAAFALWEKDKTKVRAYYDMLAKWRSQNTQKSDNAEDRLKQLRNKLAAAQKALKDADLVKDTAKMFVASADVQIYQKAIDEIWDDYNKTFRGSAVMPNSKYANPKFDAMIDRKGSNDVTQWVAKNSAGEYYKSLMTEYVQHQKLVGYGNLIRNSWDTFSYMAPPVRSEGLQKIQKDGMFEAAKDFGRDTFKFLETDIAYGEAINANKELRNKVVPIHFVTPIDEKFVSRDIGSTIIQFGGMAYMYNRKSAIQGAVIMMSDVIERRAVLEEAADGIPVINKLAAKLGYARYKKTKDGKESNNFKHLQSFIESNFYGEKEILSIISPQGKAISLNKLSAKIATFTAMNNLAGNLLQVGNQIVIDNIRMQEEAAAKEFFSPSDYLWAKKEYFTTGAISSMQDLGSFAAKSKIVQAAQIFDAFQNIFGEQMDKKTGARVLKGISLSGMFSLQHAAEHESAITRMLALFKSYEGKLLDKQGNVLNNKEGKPANLYDLIEDDGTGVFRLKDEIYFKDSEDKIRKFNKLQVINKISSVTKKTNQIKSEIDKVHLQRLWGGKLIMLFRNYFVPSLRRHFGHMGFSGGLHRDLEANKLSEGTLFTGTRFIKDLIKSGINVGKVWGELNEFEKANLKRLSVTGSYYIASMLLVSAIMGMIDDDDEEKTYANLFLLYQAKRVQSELTQFVSIKDFIKLASSPTAAVRPFQKGLDLIDHILYEEIPYFITGDTEGLSYERKSGIHQKGDSKFLAKLEAMLPILNGLNKSRTPEEAVKWFDLPLGSNK